MARIAKSLLHLRDQVNALAPGRDKSSDGTFGDPAHAARKSDHNPDARGVVCALDISNDPAHGIVSEQIAETIRLSKDPRIGYIISNKKISNPQVANGAWRPYNGSNPHDHHCHISCVHSNLGDDERDWKLPQIAKDASAPAIAPVPLVKPGSTADVVKEMKALLVQAINSEIGYGPLSEALVRAYQKHKGFTVDGIVGRQTWEGLRGEKK